jgi:Ca2+-binding EF-hand superfamily protein
VHVKKAHTEEEIKGWFKMLDRDGSGRIDREEHLRWSLNAAALASGADIRKAFAKYDRDNSGTLTELEFCRAARDVGVGDHAEQLFRTLPGSEDGEVRYMDLVEAAGDKSKFTPNEVKGFIIAMAWDTTKDSNDVDTSGWSFTADDVEGFRRALADLLAEHKVRLSKIFEKIDRDDDNLVDPSEFVAVCKGMLGYQGKDEVLDAAFQELDDDRSGHVQFDEISSWLEGKATAKQMRMQKVGERARARARTTRIYNRSTTTRTCPPRTLLPALDDLLASRCVCTVACACPQVRSMKLVVPLSGPEGSDGCWSPDQLREELLATLTSIGCETTDLIEVRPPALPPRTALALVVYLQQLWWRVLLALNMSPVLPPPSLSPPPCLSYSLGADDRCRREWPDPEP